ncbi:phosphatidylglycerol/phosphatidylinositol transfer protein-like [Silene latifolia]|uniref:phosphatidylglycerol/phosphatidylinositol transfer protein-like n=1 Tax=Silene latifolia TaxID=37657 RepID=UPI003D789143
MSTFIIPLLLFTLLTRLSHATNVHYCDKNIDYEVKVYAIEVTPNPIAKGHPATLSISASTGKTISGGKVKIDVAYYGWHVYSENHDLCTETSCPVPTGHFVIAHSEILPAFIIPGTYYVKMNIMDANNKQMSCVGFDITIGFGASVAAS